MRLGISIKYCYSSDTSLTMMPSISRTSQSFSFPPLSVSSKLSTSKTGQQIRGWSILARSSKYCLNCPMKTLLRYDYKQKNDWTCGPAVARVLLHYYDTRMDIQDVVKELKTTRNGTNNASLMRLLRRRGLKFRAKQRVRLADIKTCLKNHWVVVAYWIPSQKESHYSIVKKITAKRIYFHDTWFGSSHSYDLNYFLKNWWDQEATRWLLAVRK